ncbi:MAG: cytochrome c [Bacteroidetes bacterium]|nr:cytochrome c [Bacteroidota bacterium]
MQLKDEIDFKELLKNPVRLFGASYLYFLLAGGFLGVYYIWNMNDVSRNGTPPVIPADSTRFIEDIPMALGVRIPPVDVKNVASPTKELVEKGAVLFKANCASCHGENGMGDGATAATLAVKPRNFHDAAGWKNGRKVSEMYKTLQEGLPATGMPSFNYLSAEDRFAMIHYVHTFGTDIPKDTPEDLANLEKTYSLSKGVQLAPHIPVKLAMEKLEKESRSEVNAVNEQTSFLEKQQDATAKFIKALAVDEKKIVTTALNAAAKKSLNDFIKIVSADPFTNGFKPEVLRLNTDEWNTVYNYLIKLSHSNKS